MKHFPVLRIMAVLAFILAAAGPAIPAAAADGSPQTYTVLVGAENVKRGLDVMAYFPQMLRIHAGDTVLWKQNTHEIHTVTFLAGAALPELIIPVPATPPLPGPLMLNPQVAFPAGPADGMYDGSTYANSGVMSTDPGQPTEWSLTFTQEGTFNYICVVHGAMMSGRIVVVGSSVKIPSPIAIARQAKRVTIQKLAHANALLGQAMSKVPKAKRNLDGTRTYTVLIGWSQGQYDLMRFFPKNLVVHPNDTVIFRLSKTNDAPHTVTFYNGAADIPFIVPVPNPPGPPFLLINPEVLAPIQPGVPLTSSGIFSSGLLAPGDPGPTSYTLKIGDTSGNFPYDCILHDSSGMTGMLKVVPK
jgi:plastocyanin